MLFVLCIYFFLSTTVHPWYIVTLVALSIFTRYRFAYIWSAMVVLSYFAYSQNPFHESNLLLIFEYGVIFVFFFWELFRQGKYYSRDKLYP